MLFEQSVLSPRKCTIHQFPKDLAKSACFAKVYEETDLEVFENPGLKRWMCNPKFVVLGTGGSSLGGRVIQEISGRQNVKFIDNLDPNTLGKVLESINPEETGFLSISKSGETLETLCQTILVLNILERIPKEKREDRFVVITEAGKSSLMEIARRFNFLCLEHPKNIGGRFSIFSLVGMLPAALCGMDPLKIRSGGKKVLENQLIDVAKGASFVLSNLHRKIFQHVSFIYSDKLANFGLWLAQLYAESTGKSGAGVTPITALGAMDQHSQLQLYLDGPRSKCFTFFFEKQETSQKISVRFPLPTSLIYLKDKLVTEIFRAQHDATVTTLLERRCPVRRIEFSTITSEILGALFMHFMLEVAFVGKQMGINPFDQPAVERGKALTKELLWKIS
ncbi:MAG: hypothetical protein LBG20_01580 [Holosporaceae bacterium]|nr:hypothetical protein [Holosporaceae bacterium]